MLKKPLFWIIVLLLIVAVIYLFLPLTSSEYAIQSDTDKLNFKKAFLEEKNTIPDSSKPNIVLIVADDLGKYDISLYGGKNMQTPHIDSIGHQGAICTEGYVTSPICSPSRAGFLTGRYQQRFGHELQPNNRYPKSTFEYLLFKYILDIGNLEVVDKKSYPSRQDIQKQGLPPTEITLGELLKKNGYQTSLIGKWHLGFEPDFVPNRRGFDYQYGFYEAFTTFADSSGATIVNSIHQDFLDKYVWEKGRLGPYAIRLNDKIIEEKDYLTDKIAAEALNFIEKNKNKPFFLYLPFNAPHTPFQAQKKHYDKFAHIKDHNKRVYYAMIANLDEAVGSITRKLRESGLEKNTIIYFISDNGGATYTHATNNAPLKGGKFTHFEGGINVPFMVKWKGKIPAGTIYKNPVSALDIFVSSAAISGSKLPTDREYDGVNLLPFLSGESIGKFPHQTLYWRAGESKAIRKENWKLVIGAKNQAVYLYDLGKDKNETTNQAPYNPKKVKELQADIKKWEEKMNKPLWPGVVYYTVSFKEGKYYFAL